MQAAAQQQFVKISRYYLMTTLDREVKLQNLFAEMAPSYSFAIDILFWDDLQDIICGDQALLSKYYPGMPSEMSVSVATVNRIIADLADLDVYKRQEEWPECR